MGDSSGRHQLAALDAGDVDLPVAERFEEHLERRPGLELGDRIAQAVVDAVAEGPVGLDVPRSKSSTSGSGNTVSSWLAEP